MTTHKANHSTDYELFVQCNNKSIVTKYWSVRVPRYAAVSCVPVRVHPRSADLLAVSPDGSTASNKPLPAVHEPTVTPHTRKLHKHHQILQEKICSFV